MNTWWPRKERREQQLRAWQNQQKEIADTKAFIERFRYQATKAVQVQQRIRQLEKIVPIEVDEVDNKVMHLKFPPVCAVVTSLSSATTCARTMARTPSLTMST